jgi:hypothetical protein
MNPFIKKETRLLLPSLGIACALTLANLLITREVTGSGIGGFWYVLSWISCPLVAVMMALNTFGVEVSNGTFSMLLAQPVARLKIWQTKIGLLAGALSLVTFLWMAFFILRANFSSGFLPKSFDAWLDFFAIITTFGLAVFSGGLWTVLLLRQVAAAFWFTLLVPGVILMILAALFGDGDAHFFEGITVTVLDLYSLAGFLFARWLFLRAQDVQWSGGTIVMPEMRGRTLARIAAAARRRYRPRAALWRKEILLHQSQFVMAFVLAVLHVGVLAVRKFHDLTNSPDLKFILENFLGLWLVMPLLVGCAAIAEERKLGTLPGQLCLPVKSRTQFGIKFVVVLELSLFLGVVMPLLLEGTRICPGLHFQIANAAPSWHGREMIPFSYIYIYYCLATLAGLRPLLPLVCVALVTGAVAFYVSSFARNTLQTLAPAVIGLLLFVPLALVVQPEVLMSTFHIIPPWRGNLIYVIGAPVLVIILVGLAHQNFKQIAIGWRTYVRNGLTWIVMLLVAMIATSLVYNRAWEKLTPFEPSHGQPRLTLSNPATLQNTVNAISVRLPDGRVWAQNYAFGQPLTLWNQSGTAWRMIGYGGQFYEGSNWANVIRTGSGENVGIKTDGTLWVSASPMRCAQLTKGGWKQHPAGNLIQFGADTNWSSLIENGISPLLVKTDGTLWRWGPTTWDYNLTLWPGLRAFTPERLGTESNWAGIFRCDQLYFVKTDGSLWSSPWNGYDNSKVKLDRGFYLQRMSLPQAGQWHGTARIWQVNNYNLGVRSDGTFRIWQDDRLQKIKGIGKYEPVSQPVDLQIGKDTNWLALAGGSNNKVVTLKDDGSLWLWNFGHDEPFGVHIYDSEHQIQAAKPVRLGIHSDWIAIANAPNGIFSLAADGSVWFWQLQRPDYAGTFDGVIYYANSNSHVEPLLALSRKPQFLANVFGGKN